MTKYDCWEIDTWNWKPIVSSIVDIFGPYRSAGCCQPVHSDKIYLTITMPGSEELELYLKLKFNKVTKTEVE